MNIEGGGDIPKTRETPNSATKEMVDRGFSGGRKLYGDIFNVWPIYTIKAERLSPVPHYVDAVQSRYGQSEADYVLRLSDIGAIDAYNQLVDEFNTDLDRIKQENDIAAKDSFVKKAREIIYKKV